MARYKTINGITTECTAAEVAELDAMKAAWDSKAFDRAIADLRFKRNVLLSETDWMANSDVTMSEAMRTYRQELRDITNGLTTVEQIEAVVFPIKP
jgi:hypothetical protein